MFIVEHARNTRYRSHRIAGDTVPGTARPVLLMKHRSCHKSRSRMPRRKRLVVRSVGAGHTAGIFQRVDRSGHQRDGKGIRHQHPAPRTAPPDSSDFQPQHQRCGSILQIIVIMETERRYIIVPQMTKSPIPLLHDQTCDNKGNSDIGYSIGTRRGYPLHIPDKRAAAEGGVIGLNVSTWAKAPIDTPSRRHSNSNFFIYQIQDSDRIGKTCSHRLPTAGTGTDAAADTPHAIREV